MKKPPLQDILEVYLKNYEAIPAINVQTPDHLSILSGFAKKRESFIIAQFSARFIDFFDRTMGLQNLITLINDKTSKIYFHLDHCDDFDTIGKCIDAGFDSVMFDGSHGSIEQNIKKTKEVMKMAHHQNILVEGEVGAISGVEDGFGVEAGDYADLDESLYYYNETKVDMLALAIGNAHGFYKSTRGIKIDMLSDFTYRVGKRVPLVLHGGTGIPYDVVRTSIDSGVIKVNYSTDFKKIHQDTLREEGKKELFNGIRFFDSLQSGMSEKLEELIKELKSK